MKPAGLLVAHEEVDHSKDVCRKCVDSTLEYFTRECNVNILLAVIVCNQGHVTAASRYSTCVNVGNFNSILFLTIAYSWILFNYNINHVYI